MSEASSFITSINIFIILKKFFSWGRNVGLLFIQTIYIFPVSFRIMGLHISKLVFLCEIMPIYFLVHYSFILYTKLFQYLFILSSFEFAIPFTGFVIVKSCCFTLLAKPWFVGFIFCDTYSCAKTLESYLVENFRDFISNIIYSVLIYFCFRYQILYLMLATKLFALSGFHLIGLS